MDEGEGSKRVETLEVMSEQDTNPFRIWKLRAVQPTPALGSNLLFVSGSEYQGKRELPSVCLQECPGSDAPSDSVCIARLRGVEDIRDWAVWIDSGESWNEHRWLLWRHFAQTGRSPEHFDLDARHPSQARYVLGPR